MLYIEFYQQNDRIKKKKKKYIKNHNCIWSKFKTKKQVSNFTWSSSRKKKTKQANNCIFMSSLNKISVDIFVYLNVLMYLI